MDTALVAATALAKLLGFRRDFVEATTPTDQAKATAKLLEAGAELSKAADAVAGLVELARMMAALGRVAKQDLN